MKIRRSLRYAVIGISLSFIIAITAGYRVSVLATEQTNDSIKEKESQIESAKSEREQMQSTLSDMKALNGKYSMAPAALPNVDKMFEILRLNEL